MPFPGFDFSGSVFTPAQQQQLQQFGAYLQGYLSAQHTDDGAHGNVTATSLVSTGPIRGTSGTFSQAGSFGGNVSANATGASSDSSGTVLPVEIGYVGSSAGTGQRGAGISIRGAKKFDVVAVDPGSLNRALHIIDRSAASPTDVVVLTWDNGAGMYRLSPASATNLLDPITLGDPGPTSQSGWWSEVYAKNGVYERGRSARMGEWTSFTCTLSSDVGTWTVGSGTQNCAYTQVGKTAFIAVQIEASTITGSPIILTVGGLPVTLAGPPWAACAPYFVTGTGWRLDCMVAGAAGSATLQLQREPSTAFPATTQLYFRFLVAVQTT